MNLFKRLFRDSHSKSNSDSEIKDEYIHEIEQDKVKNIERPNLTEQHKDKLIEQFARNENDFHDTYSEGFDSLLEDAARLVVQNQIGSTSLIQRRMKLGYNRTLRLMDQLEQIGVVGPNLGSKARDVLIKTEEELNHFLQKGFKLIQSDVQDFYEKHKIEIEKRKEEIREQKKQQQIEYEKNLIRQELLEKERKKQLQREVYKELLDEGAISNQPIDKDSSREPIPQDIMDKVWNRDGGKCVKCGSQENLEFDHIIPISRGGANTYRNLQILCKKCNLEKSNKIG
jgi:hypothetical protein